MIKTRWGLSLAGVVVMGTVGIVALGASRSAPLGLDRFVFAEPDSTPRWVQRVARVDAALERSDLSVAIYEWREAYGAAVRTRRSEPLIAVAERAMRLAERGAGSDYFRSEARHIYMHAALRARAERSPEVILGIAEAFDKLGDSERARQVRRIAEHLS
jgi:hypothetical protein